MYFVIGRDGVIYYPARGLWLLSIDRFSLLRSSFTRFGMPVDNVLVQKGDFLTLVQKWTGTGPILYRSRVNGCSQINRSYVNRLVQNNLETSL